MLQRKLQKKNRTNQFLLKIKINNKIYLQIMQTHVNLNLPFLILRNYPDMIIKTSGIQPKLYLKENSLI